MQQTDSMNWHVTRGSAMRIASPGHVLFAVTLIALGILGLIKGDFTVMWQPVPQGFPGRAVLDYLSALICLASGIGLLWQRTATLAARVLLAFVLAWLLILRLPHIFLAPNIGTTWAAAKTAVMLAAAWVLYAWFAGERDRQRLAFATGEKGLTIARAFYGLALIPFGVAHFLYLNQTTVLVPRWLGWPVFWAYFTGGAFIAAGVAMLIGVFARLAATLSVLQVGLFTLIIWIPMVVTGRVSAFQWQEFIASVVLTTAGWVVADSYRGIPWLALGKR